MRCWHAGLPYTAASVDRDNITVTYAAPLPSVADAVWPSAWEGNKPQEGEYIAHHWPTQCCESSVRVPSPLCAGLADQERLLDRSDGEWLRQGRLQEEAGRLSTAVRKQLFGVALTHPAAGAHPAGGH